MKVVACPEAVHSHDGEVQAVAGQQALERLQASEADCQSALSSMLMQVTNLALERLLCGGLSALHEVAVGLLVAVGPESGGRPKPAWAGSFKPSQTILRTTTNSMVEWARQSGMRFGINS